VHEPAPECPECGFVYEAQKRDIEHVAGDLVELDLAAELNRWRDRPLRDVLREAKDEDLAEVARARGYKPAWAFYQRQLRQQRRTGTAA
jgi:hypothetical protein